MVEQRSVKALVVGSIPTYAANFKLTKEVDMADVFRKKCRTLNETEKKRILGMKEKADELLGYFQTIEKEGTKKKAKANNGLREISIAKTHLETAVMWATKAITA